jgi:hypothetical protein
MRAQNFYITGINAAEDPSGTSYPDRDYLITMRSQACTTFNTTASTGHNYLRDHYLLSAVHPGIAHYDGRTLNEITHD